MRRLKILKIAGVNVDPFVSDATYTPAPPAGDSWAEKTADEIVADMDILVDAIKRKPPAPTFDEVVAFLPELDGVLHALVGVNDEGICQVVLYVDWFDDPEIIGAYTHQVLTERFGYGVGVYRVVLMPEPPLDPPLEVPGGPECWAVLELEPGSDVAAVKRARAKLVRQYPPDKDAATFQRIQVAYEEALAALRDSSAAKRCDRCGQVTFTQSADTARCPLCWYRANSKVFKEAAQMLPRAAGDELDRLGDLFDLPREAGEADCAYRIRLNLELARRY